MKQKILASLAFLGLLIAGYVCVQLFQRHQTNQRLSGLRQQVYALIQKGDLLEERQQVIREHGFDLVYETPIWPTLGEDYQQQLVKLAERDITWLDTLCYVTGMNNPMATASVYVAIDADADGVVIRVE